MKKINKNKSLSWLNKQDKLSVDDKIKDAMNTRKEIVIKILKEVPFEFDNYYKDMQRLASEENKYIDQYQKINQCLEQVPEGTRISEEEWEIMKTKKSIR